MCADAVKRTRALCCYDDWRISSRTWRQAVGLSTNDNSFWQRVFVWSRVARTRRRPKGFSWTWTKGEGKRERRAKKKKKNSIRERERAWTLKRMTDWERSRELHVPSCCVKMQVLKDLHISAKYVHLHILAKSVYFCNHLVFSLFVKKKTMQCTHEREREWERERSSLGWPVADPDWPWWI